MIKAFVFRSPLDYIHLGNLYASLCVIVGETLDQDELHVMAGANLPSFKRARPGCTLDIASSLEGTSDTCIFQLLKHAHQCLQDVLDEEKMNLNMLGSIF